MTLTDVTAYYSPQAKPPSAGQPVLATPTESTQTRNEQAPTDITTELKSATKQYKALVSQSTDLTPDQKAQKMHLKTRIKELKATKASEAQNAQASEVTATVRQGTGLALEEAVDPVDEKRWVDPEGVGGLACRRHISRKGEMSR